MVARRQVILAYAVPFAGLDKIAGIIEAQIGDDILGPAEAVGRAFEPIFGGENAVAPACCRQPQEIGVVAEQAKAVLDFPDDAKIACSRKGRSRRRGLRRPDGRRGRSGGCAAVPGACANAPLEKGSMMAQQQHSQNEGKAHFCGQERAIVLLAPGLRRKCEGGIRNAKW